MTAECSIIGGDADARLLYAIRLRRIGIATFTEFASRKRAKAFARAAAENRWGKGGVYDLDDAVDRAWLDRDDLTTVGV